MPFILFDVGANWGSDSLSITRDTPHYNTFAFEPTPELVSHLTSAAAGFSNRYTIIPAAVSDFNGTARFNVAAHDDWGVSSLFDFVDDLSRAWSHRRDFYVDRTITVPVIRLDQWFAENGHPDRIDFFHCDTQGSDIKVLDGMGQHIDLIVEGVIEIALSKEVSLYRGQPTKADALDFLSDKGFEVFRTTSQPNEENLFFRKKAR